MTRDALEISGFASLTLHDLIVSGGFSLTDSCASCVYCPTTTFNLDSLQFRTDQNTSILQSDFADFEVCRQYHEQVVIRGGVGTEILVQEVEFVDIRHQPQAIIYSDCSNLELTQVTFRNVMSAKGEDRGAVIIVKGGGNCGTVQYQTGQISLVNNGFELSNDWTFAGFLKATSLRRLEIDGVQFNGGVMCDTLIECSECSEVLITNSEFSNNVAQTALFSLSPPPSVPGTVNLVSLQLTSNLAIQSLILVNSTNQRLTVSNSSFTGNLICYGSVVFVVAASPDNSIFEVAGSNFLGNISPRGVDIQSVETVAIHDTRFSMCGDARDEDVTETMKGIMKIEGSYILNVNLPYLRSNCDAVVSIYDAGNVNIHNTVFGGNRCRGSPGVRVREIHHSDLTFQSLQFLANTGPGGIHIIGAVIAEMRDLLFVENQNLVTSAPACVHLEMGEFAQYRIEDAEFRGNAAVASTVLLAARVWTVSLRHVTLISNTAITVCAGVLFQPFNGKLSTFTLSDSHFSFNTANTTGALTFMYMNNKPQLVNVPMRLTILRSTFRENRSSHEGSSVSVLTFMQLESDSSIEDCEFEGNSCNDGGAGVYAEFRTGHLVITHSQFLNLSGVQGSAVFHRNHGMQFLSTRIQFEACTFRNNSGSNVIYAEGLAAPALYTRNCSFLENRAIGVTVLQGIWEEVESLFANNSAALGSALFVYNSNITLLGSRFISNSASQKGGAVVLTNESLMRCTDCDFEDNFSQFQGGAVYADEDSEFDGRNVTFVRNRVAEKGSACYFHRSILTLESCTLVSNSAGLYGTIFLTAATANLTNTEMYWNTATIRSPGISSSIGTIYVQSSSFHDQQGVSGGCMFGTDQTKAVVDSSTFRNCTANSGGAFVFIALSELTLRNTSVSLCSARTDGGMLTARITTIRLESVNVTDIASAQDYGALALLESTLTVNNTQFASLTNTAIYSFASTLTITHSVFSNIRAFFGGAVYCAECASVSMSNSSISNCTARRGGALVADRSALVPPSVRSLIQGNAIANNAALDGGALHFTNMFVVVAGNLFLNNSALQSDTGKSGNGFGGAVYFTCPSFSHCLFNCSDNEFSGNMADVAGGGVYWYGSFPTMERNKMQGNNAFYGGNVASYAVRLAPLREDNSLGDYSYSGSEVVIASLPEVASGQMYTEPMRFALVDHYGNVVTTDSSSTASMLSYNGSEVSLAGNTQESAHQGVFTFVNFSISAPPATEQQFALYTSGVNLQIKSYAYDPTPYYPTVLLHASMRDCEIGEYLTDSTCYPCPENTFSLSPDTPCLSCPSAAVCYGTFVMVPRPGYWRPDPLRNLFFECINKDACLGSPDPSHPSLVGLCKPGYRGNLCSTCTADRSSQANGVCALCPSTASNLMLTMFLGVSVAVAFVLLVAISIRSANQPRSELAIYVKLFLNYLQMVMVAGSLQLQWPAYVSLFLNGQQAMGSATEQLLSIECLLKEMSADEVYYTNIAVYVTAPGVIISVSSVTWMLIAICSKTKHSKQKFIGCIVLLIFLLHTSLTKITFSVFNCKELLPTEYWLVGDLSVRCWDASHITNVLRLALPGLVVWVVGLPTLCLIFLMRMKRFLADTTVKLQLSFLYKGYRTEWYFWEFVILYRKIAVVSISVFLSTVSTAVQALSMMAVILVCFFLQLLVRPFHTQNFNSLELKGLLASFLTLYAGLYFETKSIGTLHADNTLKVLIFVLIIVANAYFFLSWLRLVVPLLLDTLRKRLISLKSRGAVTSVAPDVSQSSSLKPGRSADGSRPSHSPSDLPSPDCAPNNTSLNLEHLPAFSLADH